MPFVTAWSRILAIGAQVSTTGIQFFEKLTKLVPNRPGKVVVVPITGDFDAEYCSRIIYNQFILSDFFIGLLFNFLTKSSSKAAGMTSPERARFLLADVDADLPIGCYISSVVKQIPSKLWQ